MHESDGSVIKLKSNYSMDLLIASKHLNGDLGRVGNEGMLGVDEARRGPGINFLRKEPRGFRAGLAAFHLSDCKTASLEKDT